MKYLLISLLFLLSCTQKQDCEVEKNLLNVYKTSLRTQQKLRSADCDFGILFFIESLSQVQRKKMNITRDQMDAIWAQCEKL